MSLVDVSSRICSPDDLMSRINRSHDLLLYYQDCNFKVVKATLPLNCLFDSVIILEIFTIFVNLEYKPREAYSGTACICVLLECRI